MEEKDVKFLDLFNPTKPRSDDDLVKARLDICKGCGHFTGVRCRMCGCFMELKTTLRQAKCPIGKW